MGKKWGSISKRHDIMERAKDMISWRDNVVISLKDWMDPTKLAILNHKGIENYGWKFNNSAAMYVLSPVEAARLGVFTYTDNLTFKITKRNRHPLYQKEAPLQYGFSSIQLHEYITKPIEVPQGLWAKLLKDGYTIHYGIIPHQAKSAVNEKDRINQWRYDQRQLSTASQNYIEKHDSASVSPTIIPQMDIRCDMRANRKIALQIQGTQLDPHSETLLYIWVLPVEDRDYNQNITDLKAQQASIQKEADKNKTDIITISTHLTSVEREMTGNEQLIANNGKEIATITQEIADINTRTSLTNVQDEITRKLGILDHKIQTATIDMQAQMARVVTEHIDKHIIDDHTKEISYFVKDKAVDRPYESIPETGLIPGGRKRRYINSLLVTNTEDGLTYDVPQDGSEQQTDVHDTPTGRRDHDIPRTPRPPKSKSRKQLYFEG